MSPLAGDQVMAPFFMTGMSVRWTWPMTPSPSARRTDHWYTSGGAHRVRAVLERPCQHTFPAKGLAWPRLAPGLHQLGAREASWTRAAHTLRKGPPVVSSNHCFDGAGMNAGSAPNAVGGALPQASRARCARPRPDGAKTLPADLQKSASRNQLRCRNAAMPRSWLPMYSRKVRVDRASGRVRSQKLDTVAGCRHIIDHGWRAWRQMEGCGPSGGLSARTARGHGVRERTGQDLNLEPYNRTAPRRCAGTRHQFCPKARKCRWVLASPATKQSSARHELGNAIFNAVRRTLRPYPDQAGSVPGRDRRRPGQSAYRFPPHAGQKVLWRRRRSGIHWLDRAACRIRVLPAVSAPAGNGRWTEATYHDIGESGQRSYARLPMAVTATGQSDFSRSPQIDQEPSRTSARAATQPTSRCASGVS